MDTARFKTKRWGEPAAGSGICPGVKKRKRSRKTGGYKAIMLVLEAEGKCVKKER